MPCIEKNTHLQRKSKFRCRCRRHLLLFPFIFIPFGDFFLEMFIWCRIIKSNITKCAYAHTYHFGMHHTPIIDDKKAKWKIKERTVWNTSSHYYLLCHPCCVFHPCLTNLIYILKSSRFQIRECMYCAYHGKEWMF